jgi:hypothetical protein
MSTPILNENDTAQPAMIYAPPWAREGTREGREGREAREEKRSEKREETRNETFGPSRGEVREADVREAACAALEEALRDAPVAAAENVLAASEQLRRTLPPASQLGDRRPRWREPAPFEGDIAIVQLRERGTLEPVAVPAPPASRGSSNTGVLTRVVGAVGLAALAAFFMVGTTPFSFAVKAEGDTAPSLWARLMTRSARPQPELPAPPKPVAEVTPPVPVVPKPPAIAPIALADRFAAVAPAVEPPARIQPRPVQTVAVPQVAVPQVPAAAAPAAASPPPEPVKLRTLDPDEVATLYRRSEELISQGDIAGGRLLLTRAAEGGDARSALALGATYDPAVLGKLGVLGVRPNAEKARTWYAKAAEFGSGEASRRLEVLAQGR